jgi:mxaJ protein
LSSAVRLRRFAASARHAAAAVAASLLLAAAWPEGRVLRVCADPNNLPFSNQAGEGFENRIAELLAKDRGARLEYTWWAQRRGFVRNTLQAGSCDVVIGVPSQFELTRTSRPYYRSTYVFAARRDRLPPLGSLDDPRLRELRIGVQMIGDDFANTPPAHALAKRGLVHNVVGFPVYGDYSSPAPLSAIVSAVDRGNVDAALIWGPAAGYFARAARHRLALTPVTPHADSPSLPFVFDISMGVRRDDAALQAELDGFIGRRRADIDRILDDYGVPRVEEGR